MGVCPMSISAKISRFALPASFLLGLSGCASLPSAGPSAGAIGHAKDVDVVRVTPDYASAMAVQVKHEEADELQRSLIKLAFCSFRASRNVSCEAYSNFGS